jgi:hypothetical protein
MSDGRVIRGILFTDERIAELEKYGLTGTLLDLHLSYGYVFSFYCTACGCYDAYNVIFKARIRTEQNRSLPVHYFRHFFTLVESSLRDNIISSIFKIIDSDSRVLNLMKLLIDIKKHHHLFNNPRQVLSVVNQCRQESDSMQYNKDVVELLKYRNNYVSHQSNKMTYEGYWLRIIDSCLVLQEMYLIAYTQYLKDSIQFLVMKVLNRIYISRIQAMRHCNSLNF